VPKPNVRSDQSRVPGLDLLRLAAVAAVVFYHYGFWGPASHGAPQVALPYLASYAQYGFLGVPIFFAISGFVIAYSAEGRTPVGFAIARFSRIYPTFLFCMTLTFATILLLGGTNFEVSFAQWFANLFVAAPALGQSYVDTSYWSLVIEVAFYAWVAAFLALGLFPRRIDAIILVWLGITFANELTIDAPIFEKIFIADDSGFFAVGLLIYEWRSSGLPPMSRTSAQFATSSSKRLASMTTRLWRSAIRGRDCPSLQFDRLWMNSEQQN
jgi:peptidoglycan/LPS O-acetylase OafA/YrhL